MDIVTRTLFVIPSDSLGWTGLLHTLQQFPDFEIVGRTSDSRQAIEQVGCLTPHVILLARQVGGASCSPLAAQLRIVSPASRLLIVADTMAEGAELARLVQARVHCQILCGEISTEELYWSLRLIADRDMRMVSGPVLDRFLESYERLRHLDGRDALPRREHEVVALLAEGLTRKAIRSRLKMARTTVSTHIGRAKVRLGASTDAELIAAARRHGLLPSDGRARRP